MENTETKNPRKDRESPVLVVLIGQDSGREFRLDKEKITIGRANDRDITFKDRAMSRQHCEIYRNGDAIIIRDMGSQNGLRVNGRVTMEQQLRDQDQIDVGSTRLIIKIPSELQSDSAERG